MDNCENTGERAWDRGWEEHKLRQLVRMSRLTMAQKLQWLEDMHNFYEKLAGAQEQSARLPKSSDRK